MIPSDRQSPSLQNGPTGPGAASVPARQDAREFVEALCEHDEAALEALCGAGFELSRVEEPMRIRAERVMRILGLLDAESRESTDAILIDATCARVARARALASSELEGVDEDAFEALVNAGMEPSRCPAAVRDAAARQAEMLSALDVNVSTIDRNRVISMTLSRVEAAVRSEESRRTLVGPEVARSGARFRWSDLVSVAAVLLIGGAVLTPMLGSVRGVQRRLACASNMAEARAGFGSYALDYRDLLPLASPSTPGQNWWNIGRADQSNSANLFTMVRTQHARPEALACGGNPRACRASGLKPAAVDWGCIEEVSYSYQNMFARERPRWSGAPTGGAAKPDRTIVLADASPVIRRALRNEWINPLENSPNHGTGQNVLFTDGSSQWLRSPVVRLEGAQGRADNIWLPRALEEAIEQLQNPARADPLRGTESPVGADDVFLAP